MVIKFGEMQKDLHRAWKKNHQQFDDPDFDDPADVVVALVFLTGARFHGPAKLPPHLDMDQGCAEALIAQWYGLDEEEAVETENTVDMRRKPDR